MIFATSQLFRKKKYVILSESYIFIFLGNFKIYPNESFDKLKIGDTLNIGFSNLIVKITSKKKEHMTLKVNNPGFFEKNKGISLKRKIKLNSLTKKDYKCIKIAKK